MRTLRAVPLTRKEVNDYISVNHRHHQPAQGDKYRIGAYAEGKLVGVVQVGRPVARNLDDGKTLEVTRLCSDGTKDVCSFLYSRAARVAKELGYERIITYILESEPGTSLNAVGWKEDGITDGGAWGRPSRPRKTTAPTVPKKRFVRILAEVEKQ